MLRKSDMCSIKYLRVCKNDNKIFEDCQPQQTEKVLDENMRGIPT
jgi:hypothetical protein